MKKTFLLPIHGGSNQLNDLDFCIKCSDELDNVSSLCCVTSLSFLLKCWTIVQRLKVEKLECMKKEESVEAMEAEKQASSAAPAADEMVVDSCWLAVSTYLISNLRCIYSWWKKWWRVSKPFQLLNFSIRSWNEIIASTCNHMAKSCCVKSVALLKEI